MNLDLLKSYLLFNNVKWNDLIFKSIKLRLKNKSFRKKSCLLRRIYQLLSHIFSIINIFTIYKKNYIVIPKKHKLDLIKYIIRNSKLVNFNFTSQKKTKEIKTDKKNFIKSWVFSLFLLFKNIFYNDQFISFIRVIEDYKRRIFNGDIKHTFFYGFIYRPDVYLQALVLSQYTNVTYITGSTPFYYNRRYVFLPEVKLISSSAVQYTEIKSLIKERKIIVKDLDLGTPMFDESALIKYKKFIYDIGIYSSGIWARSRKLRRLYNKKTILTNDYNEDPLYNKFLRILEVVGSLVKKRKVKAKLYFHPHEKHLYHSQGIKPPYLKILKENKIDFSFRDKNSTLLLREAKIGVALLSTIIYERLDLGLEGYLYHNPNEDLIANIFKPSLLGEFKKYFFKNSKDLKQKIIESLKK
jgi:hypothetical protein